MINPRIQYADEPGFTHVQRPTLKANSSVDWEGLCTCVKPGSSAYWIRGFIIRLPGGNNFSIDKSIIPQYNNDSITSIQQHMLKIDVVEFFHKPPLASPGASLGLSGTTSQFLVWCDIINPSLSPPWLQMSFPPLSCIMLNSSWHWFLQKKFISLWPCQFMT